MCEYYLYVDESGPKNALDFQGRNCDWFAFGGISIKKSDVDFMKKKHHALCNKWEIEVPLHTNDILERKNEFTFLEDKGKFADFCEDLDKLIVSLPIVCHAYVIDRKAYNKEYQDIDDRWSNYYYTTVPIVFERVAKYANMKKATLKIFFEKTGDTKIDSYINKYKGEQEFNRNISIKYNPLKKEKYNNIVKSKPIAADKECVGLQIADLVLYAIARGQFDTEYKSFKILEKHNKLIDSHLDQKKYS